MLDWRVEILRCHVTLALFPSLTIGLFIGLTKTLGLILGDVAAIFIVADVTRLGLANESAQTLTTHILLRYDFTDRFATIGPAFILAQRGWQLIGTEPPKASTGYDKLAGPGYGDHWTGAFSAYHNRMPCAAGMLGDDLRHGDRPFILVTA